MISGTASEDRVVKAQAWERELLHWLGVLHTRRAQGIVDPLEVEALLRADLSVARSALLAAEVRAEEVAARPAVVVPVVVPVVVRTPAKMLTQTERPQARMLHAARGQATVGCLQTSTYCWIHQRQWHALHAAAYLKQIWPMVKALRAAERARRSAEQAVWMPSGGGWA